MPLGMGGHVREIRCTRLMLTAVCGAVAALITACGSSQAARPAAAAVPARVSAHDRAWLSDADQGSLSGMEAGRLAELVGSTSAVRAAGAAMMADDSSLNLAVRRAASRLKLGLPTAVSYEQVKTYDRLTGEQQGLGFDYDFTGSMLHDGQGMIDATKWEISHGSSPVLINLARRALTGLNRDQKLLAAAVPSS